MANSFRSATSPPSRRPAASAAALSENHDDYDGGGGGDTRPLLLALRETAARWKGQRNELAALGQAETAIDDLMAYHAATSGTDTLQAPTASFIHGRFVFEMAHSTLSPLRVCDVTLTMLRAVVSSWVSQGLSPGSCHYRLTCLNVMGIAVQGCRPRLPNKLKWWLTPRQQEAMRAMLGADDPLMQFADWTILTGLRVEETLRLTRDSFNEDFTEVNVPGLKTVASQATLPLSSAATVVATYVFKGRNRGLMFHTVNYRQLMRKWATLRKQMEIEHPGATLKAFRRGAARQLTVGGMPLDMLRQYLRHESVSTTMGYLRLVGGYDKDEMRKFLK